MKLTIGLVSALAGLSVASQQAAKVYMLPNPDDDSNPSIPSSVARLIFAQRFDPLTSELSTDSLPKNVDKYDTLSWINQYGKAPQSLFSDESASSSKQLLIFLEGMTEDQLSDTENTLGKKPSFTISDPPCSKGVDKWISQDLRQAGVTNKALCTLEAAKNTNDKKCWSGDNAVLRYNVQEVS